MVDLVSETTERSITSEIPGALLFEEKLNKAIIEGNERISKIPKNLKWLVTEDWLQVLKMMNVMDDGPGSNDGYYPHLKKIVYQSTNSPAQDPGYPVPRKDGSQSEFQKQLLTSVDWITRLGHEINPKEIFKFPFLKGQSTINRVSDFLKSTDSEWSSLVEEVSHLLEPGVLNEAGQKKERSGVGFGLTEVNYQRLDSQRKKIAAFFLLRTRLSIMVGDLVSVNTSTEEDPRAENIRSLFKEEIGETQIGDWVNEMYKNPLLTSTNQALFQGKNRVRSDFVNLASEAIKSVGAIKKSVNYEINVQGDVLRRLADEGVFEEERDKEGRRLIEALSEKSRVVEGKSGLRNPLDDYRLARDELQKSLDQITLEKKSQQETNDFLRKIGDHYTNCARALESLVTYVRRKKDEGELSHLDLKKVDFDLKLLNGLTRRFKKAATLREEPS